MEGKLKWAKIARKDIWSIKARESKAEEKEASLSCGKLFEGLGEKQFRQDLINNDFYKEKPENQIILSSLFRLFHKDHNVSFFYQLISTAHYKNENIVLALTYEVSWASS